MFHKIRRPHVIFILERERKRNCSLWLTKHGPKLWNDWILFWFHFHALSPLAKWTGMRPSLFTRQLQEDVSQVFGHLPYDDSPCPPVHRLWAAPYPSQCLTWMLALLPKHVSFSQTRCFSSTLCNNLYNLLSASLKNYSCLLRELMHLSD